MPVTCTPTPVYHQFVGIDIAAKTLTAAWQIPGGGPSQPLTLEQTPSGFARRQARLCASGVAPSDTLIVMEATGS